MGAVRVAAGRPVDAEGRDPLTATARIEGTDDHGDAPQRGDEGEAPRGG